LPRAAGSRVNTIRLSSLLAAAAAADGGGGANDVAERRINAHNST